MAIKLTILGVLIYAVMLLYAAAFGLLAARRKRIGSVVFAAGFVLGVGAFVLRWQEVEHAPLQNLFEVFLCLGVLIYPISVGCRRFLGVGGEAVDVLIGFILLFPAGFVFSAERQYLPPALQSDIFIPHVSAYMLSYVILAKAGVNAVAGLIGRTQPPDDRSVPYELATYRMVLLGFPFLTLGLVLGSWWGKVAWGDYWNWDPKELWSLVSWLAYLMYFHFRSMHGVKYPRANAAFVVSGLAAIVITLLWVNLDRIFQGLHSYV